MGMRDTRDTQTLGHTDNTNTDRQTDTQIRTGRYGGRTDRG